ncbi:hypothetical protein HN873_041018, partial [Arachis hypogaea]
DTESGDGSHNTAKVVGIIVGGAALILLALAICFLLWKKRKFPCMLERETVHRGNSQL